MVIKHNMTAMNASRHLGLATESFTKSTEQLSSGYKINRAADDAASLSISDEKRRQIRGLAQASRNTQDGISLCQVADGALDETADILQRMRELAVQSANGTCSGRDRQFIEQEIAQLKCEIDRIAETTNFNGAVYPLNAPITDGNMETGNAANPPSGSSMEIYEKAITFIIDRLFTYDNIVYNAGDTITLTGITSNGNKIIFDGGAMFLHPEENNINAPSDAYSLKVSDLIIDANGHIYFNSKSWGEKRYFLYQSDDTLDPVFHANEAAIPDLLNNGARYCTLIRREDSQNPGTAATAAPYPKIIIQAGASASQADKIPVRSVNATCKVLGITGLTVADQTGSTEALVLLNEAISKVSTYRSEFGETQKRLEYAYRADEITAENTQAAESRIRDTDAAATMVRLANDRILQKAGQAMLSHANQSRQGISRLLENA